MKEDLYDMFKADVHLLNRSMTNHDKTCIENKGEKEKVDNVTENEDEIETEDKNEKEKEKEKEKRKEKKKYADSNDELEYISDSEQQSVYNDNENIMSDSKNEKNICDWKKYESDRNVITAVKIATQYILNNQPFPVKRNELFNLINYHLPNRFRNYKKREAVIYLTRTYFKNNLDLDLLDIEHNKNKEYVLSQLILYEPHNNVLLSPWEHRIRGLLIFLLLPFKIYENKIPLGYLLETLEYCGWKSTKPKKEIAKFICSQRYNNKDNLISILKKENFDIEYLLAYIKLLEYVDICSPQSGMEDEMDDFFCVATNRYVQEISCDSFIEKLMEIPNKDYYSSDISYIFN